MNNKNNKLTWNLPPLVEWYKSRTHIQEGEKKILELVNFSNMNMIDIGVGGGRTTIHFAPLVNNYLGIDIIKDFTDFLEKKYINSPTYKFKCMDVLDLDKQNNKYDFVLFSHNGIDNLLDIQSYINALNNMNTICSNNGYVCFSSHNIWSQNESEIFKVKKCLCVNKELRQVYTNPKFILQLLNKYNYTEIIIIDREGKVIDLNNISRSAWLYYLCKK
jgi:ubiquinone/menaquinone biosynthesis C-methylase UbiE